MVFTKDMIPVEVPMFQNKYPYQIIANYNDTFVCTGVVLGLSWTKKLHTIALQYSFTNVLIQFK